MGNGHLCALIIDIIGTAERKDIQNLTIKEILIKFCMFGEGFKTNINYFHGIFHGGVRTPPVENN